MRSISVLPPQVAAQTALTDERLKSTPIYRELDRLDPYGTHGFFPELSFGPAGDVFEIDMVPNTWRRTSLERLCAQQQNWEELVNVKRIAKDEGMDWRIKHVVWREDGCAMVCMTDGHTDNKALREFDSSARLFIESSFRVPATTDNVSFVDNDTLWIARN